MKLLLPLLLLFISLSALGMEREDIYTLKMNQAFANNCQVAIYANISKTAFTKVIFTPESPQSFEEFSKKQIDNLKNQTIPKFGYNETFGGETQNHIFYVEGNNVYVKYEIKNPETGKFELADNLLFENVGNCNS